MTTIRKRIGRLAAMAPGEMASRAVMAAERRLDHLAWVLRRPCWRRQDLRRALDASNPALQPVLERLDAQDWFGAHAALSHHLTTRTPRFVLAPASRGVLATTIRQRFPHAAAEAIHRADRALRGRVDVLGYEDLSFAGPSGIAIDWHHDPWHRRTPPLGHWSRVPYLRPECGDHKIIWELNRHQHFLGLGRAYWLTGDRRYREGFVAQLEDWLTANPPSTGVNWASMLEIALRCLSWIWALHLFVEADEPDAVSAPVESTPWTVDLLLGLHRQLSLVERNLSTYFSPNTHLLGEALGLYVAGRVLPELAPATRWADRGRAVLIEETGRQVLADGGHAERSMHYHRYTLDFYLLALAVARATDDGPAAAAFGEAALRLARFARAVADHRQILPRIGDDDGGQLFPMCVTDVADAGGSLAIAACLLQRPELSDGRARETVAWMTGTPTMPPAAQVGAGSKALAASGYVVSRSDRRDHLVMDVGPLGYLNGGHAHADALSLTLAVAGRSLLVDLGTGCYTIDPALRDRFRSTAFHNTLTIDARSQSTPAGPFHWSSAAQATLHAWRSAPAFDFIEASHDGYQPVSHARQVVSRPGIWIVVDRVTGGAAHRADVHWHLDPAWRVSAVTGGRAMLERVEGSPVWLSCLGAELEAIHGGTEGSELGWCSPVYGQLHPTTTLRAWRSGKTPFSVVTVIADVAGAFSLAWQPAGDSRLEDGVCVRIETDDWVETVSLAAPHPAHPASGARRRYRCGAIDTDARLLIVRARAGEEITDVWATDATFIEAADGLPAIETPAGALLHTHLRAPHDARARLTRGLGV
jgi:hypothetical protein